MAESEENIITVIQQRDPNLPEYLDFELLRKEGLEHIGNLSGKIWTDHNVHDPGITILEVLVYALMDLGYRTNLPFADLIALQEPSIKDDNFQTPLEILTVNPATITDYRKLLLELNGVRNAWLQPTEQEIDLYINPDTNALSCNRSDNSVLRKCNDVLDHRFGEIHLNGLYDVCIEKDHELVLTLADENKLKEKIRTLLSDHRNLCEDFVKVNILKPLAFGICAEVELEEGVKAEQAYIAIIKALKNFIQPEVRYYTLNELMEKGKTIDEIFAGRPYRKESFGFIDNEELEGIELRKELHLSDLYTVILQVQGVRKVKKVRIGKCVVNDTGKAPDWVGSTRIPSGCVPIFALEETCIDLYSDNSILRLDKSKIHRTLTFAKKFGLSLDKLNTKVPSGSYLEDSDDFHSVQNDFPVVYGIGDDGLPENATLLRKTQALQLKGYLMFYDQILSNYAAQLANIRFLFSLVPERERTSEQRRTYFTQISSGIPNGDKLMGFYNQDESRTKDSLLAVPVFNDAEWKAAVKTLQNNPKQKLTIGNYCEGSEGLVGMALFNSSSLRAIYVNQLIDSFYNEAYTVETIKDYDGYYYLLCPNLPNDILFVSAKRYASADEATKQAKSVAFLSAMRESYHLISDMSNPGTSDKHYFDLTYQPTSYIQLIQEFTEDKEEYVGRRKQFLDHLLARFGEEFTDYTLFQYQNKIKNPGLNKETLDDQSNYVNEFAEISRNRGKAFNYLKPAWNTDNVSGYEKRVSLLSGINDYSRRNLCNFEVSTCFRLQLKDPVGNVLFRSNRSYESMAELQDAAKKILVDLRQLKTYKKLEKNLNGFEATNLGPLFSLQPRAENIIVNKFDYHQQLLDSENKEVPTGKISKMRSEKAALDKEDEFIKNINEEGFNENTDMGYRLLPLAQSFCYLNTKALNFTINPLITWKWHSAEVTKKKGASTAIFQSEEEAWDDLVLKLKPVHFLTTHDTALKWRLTIKGNITFEGSNFYGDKNKAVTSWRHAKTLGNSSKNFWLEKEGKTVRVHLRNEKGKTIAQSSEIAPIDLDVDSLIADCVSVFGSRSTKPRYESEPGKFGFKIQRKNGTLLLSSYSIYASEKEALKEMGKVFKHGQTAQNYLRSGDEGNPEYNLILKDKQNTFLAVPPEDLETAADRDKVLKSTTQFFKTNKVPLYVAEEPKKYSWTLFDNNEIARESTAKFSSKAKAQASFDLEISKEASEGSRELLKPHRYEFKIKPVAASFNFVYGHSTPQNELNPIFISKEVFKEIDLASKAYTDFAKKLSGLQLKSGSKKGQPYDFALFEENKKVPIAIQYKMGKQKASQLTAKELMDYVTAIYTKSGAPRERFIDAEMVENKEGRYEWRFYKKNAPLAKSPYLCPGRDVAERIKSIICDVAPPVSLRECPPKEKVVCPIKDAPKYHYQVCFKTTEGREFRMISYCGFNTYEEAENAFQKEWLEVIDLARDPGQYLDGRKIGVNEVYKEEDSQACATSTPIVVIPEELKIKLEEKGEVVIDYFVRMANLFPIYKVVDEHDRECHENYRYRVTVSDENFLNIDCDLNYKGSYQGSLLWVSESCYQNIGDAIAAYQHFYTLAGTSNNCRILCEKGKFCVGLVEVFAESSCEYETEDEAWDNAFPRDRDLCNDCVPGGVREFIYAADDDRNYIPICDEKWWKFKVVSPSYFVADHLCCYNSEKERDEQMKTWVTRLKELNWDQYITKSPDKGKEKKKKNLPEMAFLKAAVIPNSKIQSFSDYCELLLGIRECLHLCDKEENLDEDPKVVFIRCLRDKFGDDEWIDRLENDPNINLDALVRLTNYFPVYKTDAGYCYRLYWESNDKNTSDDGLQPCDCNDEKSGKNTAPCLETFPFISSNCYDCCEEAVTAFIEFARLIMEGAFALECVTKSEYGPYSFQIINKSRELAYHPQPYDCLQDVIDAIEITKACVNNTGMHLLEHILLRPKSEDECGRLIVIGDNEFIRSDDCLLPICPDYCCPIPWQPDLEQDDPCAADDADSGIIYYLPGGDPYSFWATLVLPAWAKRFRTQEARQTFEKFLYKEVPALVGLNILWLGPKDMCKFETAYRKWLDWMQDRSKETCPPNDGPPHCALVDCIKELESERPCPSAPGEQGDCDCDCSDPPKYDPCCLPPDTTGSIFWGHCQPDSPQGPVPNEGPFFDLENLDREVPSTATKAKPKSDKEKPVPKKKTNKKAAPEQADEKKLLAKIRKRRSQYLANVEAAEDDSKSYERALFFVKNTPTVKAYGELVRFFSRYSLQKGNKSAVFIMLIKNATLHLLDKLALDKTNNIDTENLGQLQSSLQLLKEKGLSLSTLHKKWSPQDLGAMANSEALGQLKRILK